MATKQGFNQAAIAAAKRGTHHKQLVHGHHKQLVHETNHDGTQHATCSFCREDNRRLDAIESAEREVEAQFVREEQEHLARVADPTFTVREPLESIAARVPEEEAPRRDAAEKARKLTLNQQIAVNSDTLAKLDSVTVRLGLDGSFDTTEAGELKSPRRHFLRSRPELWKTDATNQQVQVSFHGPVAIEKVLRALRLLEQREADDAARRESEGGAK